MSVSSRLAFYLLVIFSVPMQAFWPVYAGEWADWVKVNPNESIFGVCVFFLSIGTLLGVFYKSPEENQNPLTWYFKGLASLFGGVAAFIYVLHNDKQLTLLNPLWVGAVSFLSPAVIQIAHTAGVEKVRLLFKSKTNPNMEG